MKIVNFEFKAIADDIDKLEKKLIKLNPKFIGEDHQVDTYFKTQGGRLKLREGKIENALIYYERENTKAARQSDVLLYKTEQGKTLKDILTKVNGIKVVVDKKRKIYFIDNVKFHFDTVMELGTFVEVEAIDETGKKGIDELKKQCDFYFSFFELSEKDYINNSYSDLLLQKRREPEK
jgi:predicted adenylyl cyclase CyaB